MKRILFFLTLFPVLLYSDFNILLENQFGLSFVPQTNDHMLISDDLLFNVTSIGVEIYQIQGNGDLVKLSNFLMNNLYAIEREGDYLYLTRFNSCYIPGIPIRSLLKVNIANPLNPILELEVEYTEFLLSYIFYFNGYLLSGNMIFDTESLASVSPFLFDTGRFIKLSNSLLAVNSSNGTIFYDMTNPLEPFFLFNLPTNNYHYYFCDVEMLDDGRILSISNEGFCIWLQNESSWELDYFYDSNSYYVLGLDISSISIIDENLIVPTIYDLLVIDISSNYPVIIEQFPHTFEFFSTLNNSAYMNNLYVSSTSHGIIHNKLIENNLVEQNRYFDYQRPYGGFMSEDNLYYYSVDHIYICDIANPLNPIYYESTIPARCRGGEYDELGKKLYCINFDSFCVEIYDLENPEYPILLSEYSLEGYNCPWLKFDKCDPDNFYIYTRYGNITKFNLNDSGEISEIWESNIDEYCNITINNGILYTVDMYENKTISVYSGLIDGELILENTLNNISNYDDLTIIDINEEYLYVHGSDFLTIFFDITDTVNPEFVCQFSEPGLISFCDDIILARGNRRVYVFDREFESEFQEPFTEFYTYNLANSLLPYNSDGVNYIFAVEYGCIEVFSYSYENSVEEIEVVPMDTLTNHPNPFKLAGASRSPGTTISFKLADFGDMESTLVEVYNIKGQRIKQLVSNSANQFSEGEHSVVWDGTDNQGKPVSSGVYLYTLKLGDRLVASKKMMLLK